VDGELHLLLLESIDSALLQPLLVESEEEGFRFVRRILDQGASAMDDATWYGAWRAEELVAIGGLTRDPYVESPSVGRLRHLYVRKSERRRGIGRALVTALEQVAIGRFELVRLRTDTVAAARFYEALGYQPLVKNESATHQRRMNDLPTRTT
jgi:GNAT superfamily N-acetyltransferase